MINKYEIEALKDYLKETDKSEPIIARSFLEDVIPLFEEIQQYRAIGTVDDFKQDNIMVSIMKEAVDRDISDLIKELGHYRSIGTVEECREAVTKQKEMAAKAEEQGYEAEDYDP